MTITRGDVEAWYPLQRDARDIINVDDGTVNGVTLNTDAPFNNVIGSYNFDGTDDNIDTPATDINRDFSFSFWFKTSQSQAPMVVGWESSDAFGVVAGLNPRGNGTAGRLGIFIRSSNTNGTLWEATNNTYDDDSWHHAVIRYDESATHPNEVEIFVDGTQQTINTPTDDGDQDTWSQTLRLGENAFDGVNYNGLLGQVVVLKKYVTTTEISNLYNAGDGLTARAQFPLTDNLEAYYKLDGNADDATGNGHGGTVNGATSTSPGRVGDTYNFSGSDQIDLDTTSNYGITGSTNRTFSVWFKTGSSDTQAVFGRPGNISISNGEDFLIRIENGNELGVRVNSAFQFFNIGSYDDNEWHHLIVRLDGSEAGDISCVYDGVPQSVSSAKDSSTNIDTEDFQLLLGGHKDGGQFNGEIDEACIFPRAVTDGEARRIYSYGAGLRYEDFDKEHPLYDGLGVAWNLDGNIEDSKNNTFDGNSVVGATTTTGRVNDGYDFDGSDDILLFGDPDGIQSGDLGVNFTVLAWHNCDNLNENDFQAPMIHGSSTGNDDVNLQIVSDGEFRAYVDNGDGGSSARIPVTNYTDNTWILQSNRYDGSTITLDVKEDGGVENQATTSYNSSSLAGVGGGEWAMGGRSNQSGGLGDNAYGGELDIGMIYLRDIADTELEALFNNGDGLQFPFTFTSTSSNVPGNVFKTSNGVKLTVPTAVNDTQ